LKVAVTVAVTCDKTGMLETVKLTEVDPAGIVTVAGGMTALLFEARSMTSPPVGALLVMVTTPELVLPPVIDVG
jgi:hypothetical protein